MRRVREPLKIPPEVARKLGYYVYVYLHPRTKRPLYVGKGKGSRVLAHLDAIGKSRKDKVLRKLRTSGFEPRIDIVAHDLDSEETAFRVEAALIDAFGLQNLLNETRGRRAVQLGRMSLRQLKVFYAAKPVVVRDKALLIRVNQLFRHGMSDDELYEATRGVWRVNPQRGGRARFAMAVFEGVVREVYEIERWLRAGTTRYVSRSDVRARGRWEFTGRRAPQRIRNRYVDRSVRRYLPHGLQSPIVYCNC